MPASVVVAGALANKAGSGGEAWVRLSYVLGLRRLGCDVALVEEIQSADPAAVRYFGETMAAVTRFAATNVKGVVIPDSGHWLMEEQPAATTAAIAEFLR